MQQFRRRAALVEAVQWFPGTPIEGIKQTAPERGELTPRALVPTRRGSMFAEAGDWIVRGEDGHTWVCEQESFPSLYEHLATEEPANG